MKVLLVTEYFPPKIFGGGEISAEILAESLAEKGIDVSVLTSYFEGSNEFQKKNKVNIYRLLKTGDSPDNLKENLRRVFVFNNSVRKEVIKLDGKENFDIIHCLNITSTTGVANAKLNKKLVATINSYAHLCPKANLFYKEKKICSGCGFFKFIECMSVSDYVGKQKITSFIKYNPIFLKLLYLEYLRKKNSLKNFNLFCRSKFISWFVKNNRIAKKRIGIEYPLYEPKKKIIKMKDIEKKTENTTTISYIGSLEKIKGVDLLLRAYAKIKEKLNSILIIVGEGSQKIYLENLARDLTIKDRVLFTGDIDYKYIPHIYDISSIIAFLPRWPEPFSRTLLEALYYGKPIIATKSGGNFDAVFEGKNGILVSTNVNEISEKLEKLIWYNKLRKKMGEESKKLFQKKFGKDKIIESIIDFYKKAEQ
ncbi:glycosyltransferase family 4 protein [Candidatus Woesearchaeota archaeon]|nr:glycosyltransferase family 4 protein [Candidatus Woesearchaeota archaeon]